MKKKIDNPFESLQRVFHEPSRLAIMSAVCAAPKGLSFVELKEQCKMTDGNLSRHLKSLEEAHAVRLKKAFVDAKPRTTVFVTEGGRESFMDYLKALERVLAQAAESVSGREMAFALGKTLKV